jgi:hypothetical protein
MTTIKLSEKVRVSDPCYDNDVWCKTSLSNVYPGEYNVEVDKSDQGGWGNRVTRLTVIHKGYIMECADQSNWEEHSNIGVDSGQAGIFCETSYRNDELAAGITTPESNFSLEDYRKDSGGGDVWYETMCKFTLGGEQWGAYDTGVVTSSGIGDGMYPLEVVTNDDGEIVGMRITYLFPEDEEDEGDCCGVCGAELESDGSCDYCEYFENSKKED